MDGSERKVRKFPMRTANNNGATSKHHHVPVAIQMEILARLPLRSISRFRSVCKTWRSSTESEYFRRLFVSLHKNLSCSWSLLLPDRAREIINLHRCETWDLPKSIACSIQSIITAVNDKYVKYVASSNGLVFMYAYSTSFVGNPVLQQWVRIPSPPYPFVTLPFGLVTRVGEDGVVLGFKLIRIAGNEPEKQESLTRLCLCVYSSETGVWSRKRLDFCQYFTNWGSPMALNGTLYIPPADFDPVAVPGALMAYDFYGESDICRVIPLPDHNPDHNQDFKRLLTTSAGRVMYIKTLAHNLLKVWMLTNNDDWQLLWEIRFPFITCDDDILHYAPLAMDPFDRKFVYLWNQQKRYLVSCNLQTQNYKIMREDESRRHIDDDDGGGLQKCFLNQSACERHMNGRFAKPGSDYEFPLTFFPFVLPRWMESLPCPPQVELMDTTSLLSHLHLKEENREEFKDIYGIRERLLLLGAFKKSKT